MTKALQKLLLLSISLFVFFFLVSKPERKSAGYSNNYSFTDTHVYPRNNIDKIKVFFDESLQKEISLIINEAKYSITAASFTFGTGEVTKALIKASQNGIKVDVVAEKIKRKKKFPFSLTVVSPKTGIMHEKFIIIDSRDVILSSTNFVKTNSKNSGIYLKNVPKLVAILEYEFHAIKQNKRSKNCKQGCNFEYGKIFFSPGKSCSEVKKVLLKAKKSINLSMYTFTVGTPMTSALKQKAKKNVKITGIIDDWELEKQTINQSAFRYFNALNGDLKFDKLFKNGKKIIYHHKFALIDKRTLVLGSMNWTKSGCYKNREFIVITKNKEIVQPFVRYQHFVEGISEKKNIL